MGVAKRRAIVVLGMHRSGTSATARVLSLLGAGLPANVLGAGPGNEAGHWEPERLLQLDERLLAAGASRWDDWRKFDFGAIPQADLLQLRDEIGAALREEYADQSLIVLKEPRLCRLMPLYEDVLREAGFTPLFVLPVRNPLAVMSSLAARDGMTNGYAALLWLRHALGAETASRTRPRAIISYERLLVDWRGTMNQVGARLGLRWPAAFDEAAPEIEAFLTRDMHHHAPSRREFEAREDIADWVKQTYNACLALERDPDDDEAIAALDRVSADFDAAAPVFARAMFEELAARDARFASETNNQLTAFRAESDAFRARIADAREAHEAEINAIRDEQQKYLETLETRRLEDKAISIRNAVASHERIIVEMASAIERRTQEAVITRGELDEALAEITTIKADRDAILAARDAQVAAMETRHLEDKAVSIRNAVATHERIIVEMTGAVERRTQEAIIVRGELDEALAEITAIKADRDAILAAHDLQVAAMEARHASERAEAVQKEAKTRHDETEFLYAALDAQRTKTNELASLLQIEKNATRVLAGQLEGARREVRRAEAEAENYGHTIATLQQRLAATDQTIALLQQQIEAAHRSPFWRLVSFSLSLRSFFSNTSRRNVPLVILRLYARLPISHDMRLRIRSVVNRIAPDILPAIDKIHRGQTEPTKAFVEKEPIHLADTLADPRHREASWRLVNDIHNHTAQHGPVTHIIALPFLATGGAEATAINYCNAALSNAYSSVIIVATDQTPKGPWPSLPERLLTLQLTDYFPDPDSDIRVAALFNLIALVRPRVFHNINSETAWRLIIRAGDRLRRYCKIFASIFAFQYHPETGAEVGYAASFLRDGLPHLDGLLSDNRRFVRDAIERYSLQKYEGRFFPIYNPCRNFPSAILSVARQRTQAAIQPPAITGKMKILWAGRLDAEKRIDLLAKVGRICPSVEFHVFGSAVVESASLDELRLLENIVLRGPFNDPAKLVQAEHFHAFMFTSRWEGMPNVLIEFGMLGLPIIAPAVGGVSELISEATGYLLTASPSPEEYAAAISTIRAAPAQAGTRAVNLQRLIESRHSFGAFLSAVSAVPNYLTESAER